MLDLFEAAVGTTLGAKHRRGLIDHNQDSALLFRSENLLTGILSDGCGSEPNTHVGSFHLVDWFTRLTHDHAASGAEFDETVWQKLADEIANRIRFMAEWSHLPFRQAVAEAWTATLVGAVVGPEFTNLVVFGDGRFVLNGELIRLEAANKRGNAPAYLSYLVVPSTIVSAGDVKFRVTTIPTSDIKSLVAATDGLDGLMRVKGKTIPGTDKKIPPIQYLWENSEFFGGHPLALDRWLNFVGRDWRPKNSTIVNGGRLDDDVAIFTMRRTLTED